jgi:hypothetical protein
VPKAPPPRAISRFIVMAILQAARARKLGLPKNSAYSWGLNRAIFIAAAKQGFKGGAGGAGEGSGKEGASAVSGSREPYRLGDDVAYRDTRRSDLYFTIGDETQTEEDFERQIERRFGDPKKFARAWHEAEEIVASADRATLESGREFYARVYKPRRDVLRQKWTEMVVGSASDPQSL